MQENWDCLLFNVQLVTLTEQDQYGLIEKAAIAMQGGKIAWLGSEATLKKMQFSEDIEAYDGEGFCVTPGLIDCHTHLVHAGHRAQEFAWRLQGKTYAQIAQAGGGIINTVNATREASAEELFTLAAERLESLLQQGVTTIEIKSGYGLDLKNERKQLLVAQQLEKIYPVTIKKTYLAAHALPEKFAGRADEYIDHVCNKILPELHAEELIDAVDAFCESIAFSSEQVEKIFVAAKELNLPVKLHAEQLSNSGGTALAARHQALSVDHLEYVDEEQVKALAKSGTAAVLLPGAFYFLQETKKPPVELLQQYNVPIAIATDCNPGSSPTTNLLLCMNMACLFFQLTPLEALHAVTTNAAKALGLSKTHGSLEIGKQADLVLWDIEHPDQLAYSMGNNFCCGVFQSGQFIDVNESGVSDE